MAVFIGNRKNTTAAKCGLRINYAVNEVIRPAVLSQWPDAKYVIKQRVGIDTSDLFVARTAIRGSNNLVWVGRAANYAAKMATVPTT